MDKTSLDQLRIDRSNEETDASRKGLWIGLGILAVVLLALVVFLVRRPDTPEVRVASASQVATNTRASILNANGYVTARRQATVSSKVTGKVTAVYIEE